jgi:hypothetical protein
VGVGDLDGNGRQDLAVANHLDGTVSILLGDEDGTFTSKTDIAVDGSGNTSIALGDFDEDGHLDFVTNVRGEAISIQLGNGDGTFRGHEHAAHAWWLATSDFDRDGHLDLAVVQRNWTQVLILRGNGKGTFTTGEILPGGLGELTAVVPGDFNRDGRPDLAVTDHFYSQVLIFLSRPDGSFGSARRFDVGDRPTNIVVADFDGDDRLDLATPNDLSYTEGVSLLMGNGDGTFQPARSLPISPIDQATALTTGDFNGDGRADLATTNGGDRVTVHLGNGTGTFATPQRYGTSSPTFVPAVGRFNADTRDDLAVPNRNDFPGAVSIFNTR